MKLRPKLDNKVEKTIRKHLNLVNFGQNLSEESGEDSNEIEGQRFVEKNDSIKKNSPFTKHFEKIYNRVRSLINVTDSIEVNDYYNP